MKAKLLFVAVALSSAALISNAGADPIEAKFFRITGSSVQFMATTDPVPTNAGVTNTRSASCPKNGTLDGKGSADMIPVAGELWLPDGNPAAKVGASLRSSHKSKLRNEWVFEFEIGSAAGSPAVSLGLLITCAVDP